MKEVSKKKRKSYNKKQENYEWKTEKNGKKQGEQKFTSKGKQSAKVGNHPHTNISKPATVRRVQMQDIGNAFEMKRPAT